MGLSVLTVGCANGYTQTVASEGLQRENAASPGAFTVSEESLQADMRGVFLYSNKNSRTVVMADPSTGERYEFSYDGITAFTDAFGEARVVEQFEPGDVVDITASAHSGKLRSMGLCPEAFVEEDVSDYDINVNRGVFRAGDTNYKIQKGTVVLGDGRSGRFSDLRSGDRLTLKGVGYELYSVTEDSGTGFLRVLGSESFKGGYIEIRGTDIIKVIDDDMLLQVPEGTYELFVAYNHFGGSKVVSIERGSESSVDISSLAAELLKSGDITFTIDPPEALPVVKIDGETVQIDRPVSLEYGVHRLDIAADGYVTLHRYISVGSPRANLDITLEKAVSQNEAGGTKKPASKNAIPKLPETFDEDNNQNALASAETGSTNFGTPAESGNENYSGLGGTNRNTGTQSSINNGNNNTSGGSGRSGDISLPPSTFSTRNPMGASDSESTYGKPIGRQITLPTYDESETTTSSTGTSGSGSGSGTSDSQKSSSSSDSESNAEAEVDQGTQTVAASESGTLYIDGPSGVEVYFDGSYKGVAPCSFAKSPGEHQIKLKKDGYKSRTYTVTLTGSLDETYSFNKLKKEEDEEEDDDSEFLQEPDPTPPSSQE